MRGFGLVALGLYVGVLGAFVHRQTVEIGGVDWPWGLAVAITAAFTVALAAHPMTRVGGAWFGLGWAAALIGQQVGPGGGYLVGGDGLGWAFVIGGLGAVVAAVAAAPRLNP